MIASLIRSFWTVLMFSAHFSISSTLLIWILPKSFSCILLSPMNLKYRKSVVRIGGVCNSASWLQTKHKSLFEKKLYAKSWNHELCLTSTAYLNLLSNAGTKSLSLSRPSNICKEGGNCISRASGLIASKKCFNSLSTSFSLLWCVIALEILALNLMFWFHIPQENSATTTTHRMFYMICDESSTYDH